MPTLIRALICTQYTGNNLGDNDSDEERHCIRSILEREDETSSGVYITSYLLGTCKLAYALMCV